MNDRELMQRFLEKGYVITDPRKFYREIRSYSLQRLLDDLDLNEENTQTNYDYSNIEEDVLNYIRDVRNIVVNDERYSLLTSSELTSFNSLLRVLDGKYLLTSRNDERRFDINTEIFNAREEIRNLNTEVSRVEDEIRNINTRRGTARRELYNLESNTELTNIERTQRTFELMDELPALEDELNNKNTELNELKNQINNKNNEISGLEESLKSIVDEKPTFNSEMRDSLIEDIERVNSFVNGLNISSENKDRIRRLSANFDVRQSLPLVSSESASANIEELYNRFGIARTNEYVKEETVEVPVIEEPKNEDELVDNFAFEVEPLEKEEVALSPEFVDNMGVQLALFSEDGKKSFLGTHIREARKSNSNYLARWIKYAESLGYNIEELENTDEKIYINELDAQTKANESKEDELSFDELVDEARNIFNTSNVNINGVKGNSALLDEIVNQTKALVEEDKPLKKVVYTGKIGNIKVSQNGFEGLEIGKEYEVEYEDEVNYKLKGLDTSYVKDAFVSIEEWKEQEKSKVDNSNKRIFYINDTDPFEAFVAISENLANGDEVEIEEILPDGYIKLVGHESPFNPKMIISVEKWNELLKEDPTLKPVDRVNFLRGLAQRDDMEENKSKSAMFKVGDEVVFYEYPGLNDDEKEYFDVNYRKRGVEEGKKYKVSKVNDNSSVQLEGVKGNFPTLGFLPASLYEVKSTLDANNAPKKEETAKEAPKPVAKFDDNADLVVYVGKDTDKLKNGMVYDRKFAFGNAAVFVDEKGNEVQIDDYVDANFKEYVPDVALEEHVEIRDRSDEVRDLPKVTAVEEIKKLSKVGGGLTAIGVLGLVGGVLLNPLLGASTVAVLASSGAIATIGTVLQTKFALSFKASKIYKNVVKELKEYDAKLADVNEELSVDELAAIKDSKDEIEAIINDIGKASDELGISHRII